VQELEKIGGAHLIGTKYVKNYNHGYIMTTVMFKKLKEENKVFDYEEYKQAKVKEQLDQEYLAES
jgi:hypothetical protein